MAYVVGYEMVLLDSSTIVVIQASLREVGALVTLLQIDSILSHCFTAALPCRYTKFTAAPWACASAAGEDGRARKGEAAADEAGEERGECGESAAARLHATGHKLQAASYKLKRHTLPDTSDKLLATPSQATRFPASASRGAPFPARAHQRCRGARRARRLGSARRACAVNGSCEWEL